MPCAFTSAMEASAKHRVANMPLQFGDIPHNFNMIFCEALRQRHSENVDHFAMLHTDIGAERAWIDTLIEELDRTGADIMSVVVAIKDNRGLTTTGVRYPGVWGTRRLTMKEVMRLPETFAITDTDEPDQILAINTGCWVARFPKDGWPDRFPGFQNEHRIVWRNGEPVPDFDSEDWLFSDWAHAQGLKVYATRKVKAFHRGALDYPNDCAWGTCATEQQRPVRPLTKTIVSPGITIETEKPVAIDSLDHTQPLGAANDNSLSYAFNRKLFELCPPSNLRLLDLGCSGGGLVRSILEAGGFAIGVEGSDFSRIHRRAEWETIPDHLFVADATRPFVLRNGTPEPLKFNMITGWEFLEHIGRDDLDQVWENILAHCTDDAIFVGSISSNPEPHHRTAKPKDWWVDAINYCMHGRAKRFQHAPDIEAHFGDDLVRGSYDSKAVSFSVAFRCLALSNPAATASV